MEVDDGGWFSRSFPDMSDNFDQTWRYQQNSVVYYLLVKG